MNAYSIFICCIVFTPSMNGKLCFWKRSRRTEMRTYPCYLANNDCYFGVPPCLDKNKCACLPIPLFFFFFSGVEKYSYGFFCSQRKFLSELTSVSKAYFSFQGSTVVAYRLQRDRYKNWRCRILGLSGPVKGHR